MRDGASFLSLSIAIRAISKNIKSRSRVPSRLSGGFFPLSARTGQVSSWHLAEIAIWPNVRFAPIL
jgi:hypothetical protein